ncbi:MAG: branched-chain amino acid ABC transporter permease [Deltaproteobacteria bacterium]|nr:branched-chain amino acid ABC transporter permease [Deltaproteobacteria bacterium]MBW2153975.1 branched-chain amino acid ABC transporter permease [Deltaproteobacteria bacterium]
MLLQSFASGLLVGSVYALIAVGLTLIWGIMELVNFAHGSYLMVSMYICYLCYVLLGFDPLLSMPIAAGVLFFLGILTYRVIISRIMNAPMLFQIFTTFGLQFIINYTVFLIAKPTFRTIQVSYFDGVLNIKGIILDKAMLVAAVVSILGFLFLYLFLHITKTGKGIRATTDNPRAALALGVDIEKMYAYTWGVSLALVGIAGAVLCRIIYTHPTVGDTFSLFAFVAVAFGGFGSIYGALIGGLVIGVVETIAGVYAIPWFKLPAVFAVFIVTLIFRPQGLLGWK